MDMKRFATLVFCCLMYSLGIYAQTSGGQITRKSSKVPKTRKKNPSITIKQIAPPVIPISIDSLYKYNVVVGSYGLLPNAQKLCQSLRDEGVMSNIFFDSLRVMYRVFIYNGTNNEYDAKIYRNKAIEKYPDAWIMYLENGRIYRYE